MMKRRSIRHGLYLLIAGITFGIIGVVLTNTIETFFPMFVIGMLLGVFTKFGLDDVSLDLVR